MIIYEQPLNELIRVCLRLEQLFYQIDYQIKEKAVPNTRNTVTLIIHLLQLLDRPDLKAKLAKELSHQQGLLTRLQNVSQIDQEKLATLLNQLDILTRCFIDSGKKIGHNLREIELLNNLRLHLASPGGGCSFDIPLYYYWLQQSDTLRHSTLLEWLSEFDTIRSASNIILQLIRGNGSKPQQKTAEHGFYQELLNPQINLRLIRVGIPTNAPAYPEISIGRHFLSIRFFSPSLENRSAQYLNHLQFDLIHCNS
ncbi:MAG: zapD [Gammaproteobacteria bacterium]|jgi:cell division protein ZapD|nr:zapD [Gammaproteobacteria bacterium]MCE3238469.1 zapD [Gammaproteobacteria bacterium]